LLKVSENPPIMWPEAESIHMIHRALDGGPATLFLAGIKEEVEQFNHELINL